MYVSVLGALGPAEARAAPRRAFFHHMCIYICIYIYIYIYYSHLYVLQYFQLCIYYCYVLTIVLLHMYSTIEHTTVIHVFYKRVCVYVYISLSLYIYT